MKVDFKKMKVHLTYATLAVAALSLGLTSCSGNDNELPGEKAEKAKLNIRITAPTHTRAAVTSPTTVPTDAVGNFSVFITDNTGEIAWSGHKSSNEALDVTVNTTAQYVYVIANGGDLTESITTLAGLESYTADLNGTGSQATARWATGVSDKLVFEADGDNYEAETTVELTFIAARITVKVVNNMDNYGEGNTVTLDEVAVLNARGESLLFGESLIPESYTTGKMFYTGHDPAITFAYWPESEDYTLAADLLLDELTAPATDTYYYYVFENDAEAAEDLPTIVTLIGTAGNGEDKVYWPVHLASYEQWTAGSGEVTSIQRGKSYNLTITLTGDASDGGGSVEEPTEPVVSATVEVSVSLTDWVPVTLNKEF